MTSCPLLDLDAIEQRVRSAKAKYVLGHAGSPPRIAFDCLALIVEVRELRGLVWTMESQYISRAIFAQACEQRDKAEAEVRRLQDAWTRCEHEVDKGNITGNVQARRAEQAEARVAVLREALEFIWTNSPSGAVAEYAKQAIATTDAAADRLLAELTAARELLEVAERKMRFVVRDYKDDKESKAWLARYEAWRRSRGEGG